MKVGVPILFCDPLWGLEIEGTMHVRKHVLNVPQKKKKKKTRGGGEGEHSIKVCADTSCPSRQGHGIANFTLQ